MTKTPEPLDALVDVKGLMTELGVTRHVAEMMMEQLPLIRLGAPGSVRPRKYVRRVDVRKLIDRSTVVN